MSKDWFADIAAMHDYYGMTEKHAALSPEHLYTLAEFRTNFQNEECEEQNLALAERNSEEFVDSLIDQIVVAIGTLHAFGVDAYKAWDEVLRANMAKVPGIKPERPNPLGLPDLIKPEGWVAPSHAGNHGTLSKAFDGPAYGPCEI